MGGHKTQLLEDLRKYHDEYRKNQLEVSGQLRKISDKFSKATLDNMEAEVAKLKDYFKAMFDQLQK